MECGAPVPLSTAVSRNKLLKMRFRNFQPLFFQLRAVRLIAIDRVVPAFDVEVGVVTNTRERVDDLRPISVAEAGEAMLRDAGVTETVLREECAIDARVLRMHVKYA